MEGACGVRKIWGPVEAGRRGSAAEVEIDGYEMLVKRKRMWCFWRLEMRI